MRLLPVLLLRLALLVAISASAALVVDYANAGDPAFCGVTSGCFAVRTSGFAYLFGYIPLPQVGLIAFASLFGIAFVARSRLQHTVVAACSALGGVFALYLLYLQKSVIGAMCPWCVAVDSSAIVAAISSVWVWQNARIDEASVRLPVGPRVTWAWVGAGVTAILAPFVWGSFPADAPLPAAIQKEQVPDKLTIVAFTDFECPFCRKMHPVLHQAMEEQGERVHFVRKMMPLSGHPGAEPAALVYLCTPDNLREAVADKLYTAPSTKLTPEGTIVLAAGAGVDAAALSVCVKSPETQAKLDADKKLFEDLGGHGLPFTFVGKRVVLGFNPDRIQAAIASEQSGKHLSLPLWAMFVFIGAAIATAIGLTVAADDASAGTKSSANPPAA